MPEINCYKISTLIGLPIILGGDLSLTPLLDYPTIPVRLESLTERLVASLVEK
jgi:hypothetical protein